MKLYILTDEYDVIRGITTSRKHKERIEEEYTRLWELEEEYGYENRCSNLTCDTYNLGE